MATVFFDAAKNKQGGNRKRVYLFVVDENKAVVNKREQQLILLKPDFVANGQIRHCAKENALFWLKNFDFELWHLPANYFFANPKTLGEAKENFSRNFAGEIIAVKTP